MRLPLRRAVGPLATGSGSEHAVLQLPEAAVVQAALGPPFDSRCFFQSVLFSDLKYKYEIDSEHTSTSQNSEKK